MQMKEELSMKPLNWATLGCGVIANELATALARQNRHLYSVANRTHEKAVAFAEKYQISKVYDRLENKAEEAQLKGQVVVMKSDVAANTYVTKEEYDKYFEQVSVELTAIPGTVFASVNDLPQNGIYIEDSMAKSQMVLSGDISTTDAVMDKYKAGYQVTSFNAMEFADGVNGSLRKGDIVDVYAVDPATEVLTLYAENVYVSEVYDSSGKKITEDSEVATSFTVYVTPEEVESVNMAVVNGNVQLYKKVG